MQERVRHATTTRFASRVAILGMVASGLALMPSGPLTAPAAASATGPVQIFRPAGIVETALTDPLGITAGSDGKLWFVDAGEASPSISPPSAPIERYDPATGILDQYSSGELGSQPVAITQGGDGNMWYANLAQTANDVGFVNAQGANPRILAAGESPSVTATTGPTDIIAGPDGQSMWFTEHGTGRVGKVPLPVPATGCTTGRPDPCAHAYIVPGSGKLLAETVQPEALTADTANNLVWVTVQASDSGVGGRDVVAFDMSGNVKWDCQTNLSGLAGITMGSDGNVWFTAQNSNNVSMLIPGAADPCATILSFPLPGNSNPTAIVGNAPDGDIYLIDQGTSSIVEFTPSPLLTLGSFTSFKVAGVNGVSNRPFSPNVQPTGITVGPDRNIWFTLNDADAALGRLTINPLIAFSPSPVVFGTHPAGTPTPMNVTVQNTGSPGSIPITGQPAIIGPNAGDFKVTNNGCPPALALHISCTIQVTFTPSSQGTKTASLTLYDNSPGHPHSVQLTGAGAAPPTLTPASLTFPDVAVGTQGKPQTFTLSNLTGSPVVVKASGVSLNGTNVADFKVTADNCSGRTIANSSSCNVLLAFAPSASGIRGPVTLSISDNGTNSPQTSGPISGKGVIASTAPPVAGPGGGYWEVASDGGIFSFGSAKFQGSTGSMPLNKPIVGMAPTPSGRGYWLVATDGGIFAFGDAKFVGSTGSIHLNQPIVGMAATPDGLGYWLVASDGGIFNFGDAGFLGSTGSIHLNKPIVGIASTTSGAGYWLVATDGGVFAFGDAKFQGSTGSTHLNQPIVGIAATPTGGGYWFAAADGGLFNFGDAGFLGSMGSTRLNKPVVTIAPTLDGRGYWMSATDGGIFNFGDAGFFGSTGSMTLNKPMVGMSPTA